MQQPIQRVLPSIVLVRPRNPNNIGAVARAMNNFGFQSLVVVSPHPPVWDEVRSSAVGSETIISNARVVGRVLEAVEHCSLVVGTSDSRRANGISPEELVRDDIWKSGPSAILFGSEKSGLSNDDLSHCSRLVSIPTSPECPSMNLSHAVAVICYEFWRATCAGNAAHAGEDSLANGGDIERLIETLRGTLRDVGFLNERNEERMIREIRRSLMRYGLTHREMSSWLGSLRRLANTINHLERQPVDGSSEI